VDQKQDLDSQYDNPYSAFLEVVPCGHEP